MSDQRKILTLSLTANLTILLICQNSAIARSVYAIPQHWGAEEATLNVYDVLEGSDEGKLEYRATYDLKWGGACDAILDTQSDILFVTFEQKEHIQLVNARTFLSEGTVTASGASDLAGLELDYVDPNTTLLYTVDRGKNKLFVYDWDAEAKDLTLLPYSPKQDWYTLLSEDPASDPCVLPVA